MGPIRDKRGSHLLDGDLAVTVEVLGAALGIIATVVTTTVVVISKLTQLEVAIARLQVTVASFESRITELERKSR